MLAVKDLYKNYGKKEVLKGVSFLASKGQIVSLLGNNGSGKPTTFKCILNLIDYDKGSVKYDGKPLKRNKIGFLPEERSLFYDVTVNEQLRYMARLNGLDSFRTERNMEYWIKRMKVDEYRNQIPLKLSKGNQQKIQMIMALISDPEIIILDEPWTGLDQGNIDIFLDVLQELKSRNKIILLSSHQYQPVQEICDRFLYLKNGSIAINVTRGKLQEVRQKVLELECSADFYIKDKGIVKVIPDKNRVKLIVRNNEEAWRIMLDLKNDQRVTGIRKRNLTVNDLIEVMK